MAELTELTDRTDWPELTDQKNLLTELTDTID